MVEPQKIEPTASDLETNWTESVDNFDALELKSELLRGIYGNSFPSLNETT